MIDVSGREGKIQIVFALMDTYRDTVVFSNEDITINNVYIIECNNINEYCEGIITVLKEIEDHPSMIVMYTNVDEESDIEHMREYALKIEKEFLIRQVIIMHK